MSARQDSNLHLHMLWDCSLPQRETSIEYSEVQCFTASFDESLNKEYLTKQMDILVCYFNV